MRGGDARKSRISRDKASALVLVPLEDEAGVVDDLLDRLLEPVIAVAAFAHVQLQPGVNPDPLPALLFRSAPDREMGLEVSGRRGIESFPDLIKRADLGLELGNPQQAQQVVAVVGRRGSPAVAARISPSWM